MAIYEFLSGERPRPGDEGWGDLPLPADWFPDEARELAAREDVVQ